MKLFKKLSFLGKIFTGMTVTAILPMLAGYMLLLQVLNLTYRNYLNREAQSTLAQAEESLEETFTDIFGEIGRLSEDEGVRRFLSGEDGELAEDIYRKLYAAFGKTGGVSARGTDGVG